MKEKTFEEIVNMIKRSCNKNFYIGVSSDEVKSEIVRSATKIYIEQMRQIGVRTDEYRNPF